MTDTTKDTRLILMLTKRLETQRLPLSLSLKGQVDRGDTLNDFDLAFLKQVREEAQQVRRWWTAIRNDTSCQQLVIL